MLQYLRLPYTSVVSCILLSLLLAHNSSAQHVHVFPDSEASIFDQLALNPDPSTLWSTDRSANPGYFSAIGDAVVSGTGPAHYIDGYVKYYRGAGATQTSFVFPTGADNQHRPVTISGAIADGSTHATAWFPGDPGVVVDPTDGTVHSRGSRATGVLAVSPLCFWDWQTLSGTAPGMNITVSLPDVSAFAITNSLILVGWNGSLWVNMSGATGAGPYAGNWATGNTESAELTGTWQADITALAIGSSSFVLPLTLESFSGIGKNCGVELSWKTSTEVNTDQFVIEHSVDGAMWLAAGTVSAQGDGNGRTYSFSTAQQQRSVYYRLRMVDRDGQQRYSHTIAVRNDCIKNTDLKAFPNPLTYASNRLQLVMNTTYSGTATIVLTNAGGQVMLRKSVRMQQGENKLELSTEGVIPGRYLLTIVDAQGKRLYDAQQIIRL